MTERNVNAVVTNRFYCSVFDATAQVVVETVRRIFSFMILYERRGGRSGMFVLCCSAKEVIIYEYYERPLILQNKIKYPVQIMEISFNNFKAVV